MRDPFPFAPVPALSEAVQPLADRLSFPTLTLHVHEVAGAALFYTFIHLVVSPLLSTRLFPTYYPRNSRGKKVNWDAHVVSLVQSTLINSLALWVMFTDKERSSMDWQQRVWGYTGASAMIQALACGYFVWDFITTLLFLDVFGLGLLAHAASALAVFSFGFRPFLNYYSTVFILYELSTPFLNVHWFFDKLNMTGSRAQLYNGIALLITFFSCRLVWGTYMSAVVYVDIWSAVRHSPDVGYAALDAAHPNYFGGDNTTMTDPDANPMAFVVQQGASPIPVWLALVYIGSNIILNSLNWFWFVKMIAAVRKRFEPVKEAKVGYADAAKGDGSASGAAAAAAAGGEKAELLRRRRGNSIADVVPDSDELRAGTIQ
ncbi:TLC domain-containing protein [Bombardia bombarda]|uniref:TLC domain-containing protein n=1 Tax=Bombardia bombarda TaxID=252184 RepID=A0AA39X742_9PEZI|nr:TLC domain-containing protein [Bombardia bombarda]